MAEESSKRVVIEGRAVPLRGDDIDTDRIIPARFLKSIVFDGLGEHVFADDRREAADSGARHPFEDDRFAGAAVLFVNQNFGCGSSREHAPQALLRWGVRAVVGESFAEIFFSNCTAIGVPCLTVDADAIEAILRAVEASPAATVRVDLESQAVSVGGRSWPASMPEGPRRQMLEGRWDSTAELLEAKAQIADVAAKLPYFRGWG